MVQSTQRIPVNINGKGCYIDDHGSIVLKTSFLSAGWFHDNRAPVWDGQHFGFIEQSGDLVISHKFDRTKHFSDGHCAVSIGNRWGLIDTAGRWVFEPEFVDVGHYSYGRIGVCRKSGHDLVYMDLQRNVVIENVGLKLMSAYSDGLIAAGDTTTYLDGFRDTTGAWAIMAKYTASSEFSEGLAAVNLRFKKRELTGYIDTAGNEVLPFKHITTLSPFKCGLAIVCEVKNRKLLYGAINRSGDWVIEPSFAYLQVFSEGLSMFSSKPRGKVGFLDTQGNVKIEEAFVAVVFPFSQGIATVRDEGGFWYINTHGERIWRLDWGPYRSR